MLPLLTFPLGSRRDVLLARQWARRIAVLFHFPFQEQACIAAGAFTVAAQALRRFKSAMLHMKIEDGKLHIFPMDRDGLSQPNSSKEPAGQPAPADLLRLVKPLPTGASEFTSEDLGWIVLQLNQQTRFKLFEEIEHQNQEMLTLLHDLQTAQAELRQLKEKTASPSAA
jgi:hypothetical protein